MYIVIRVFLLLPAYEMSICKTSKRYLRSNRKFWESVRNFWNLFHEIAWLVVHRPIQTTRSSLRSTFSRGWQRECLRRTSCWQRSCETELKFYISDRGWAWNEEKISSSRVALVKITVRLGDRGKKLAHRPRDTYFIRRKDRGACFTSTIQFILRRGRRGWRRVAENAATCTASG